MNRFQTGFLYVLILLSIAFPARAGEITVTDSLGRAVAVPASPERIIGSGSGAPTDVDLQAWKGGRRRLRERRFPPCRPDVAGPIQSPIPNSRSFRLRRVSGEGQSE